MLIRTGFYSPAQKNSPTAGQNPLDQTVPEPGPSPSAHTVQKPTLYGQQMTPSDALVNGKCWSVQYFFIISHTHSPYNLSVEKKALLMI